MDNNRNVAKFGAKHALIISATKFKCAVSAVINLGWGEPIHLCARHGKYALSPGELIVPGSRQLVSDRTSINQMPILKSRFQISIMSYLTISCRCAIKT